jgi:hypothetical protein
VSTVGSAIAEITIIAGSDNEKMNADVGSLAIALTIRRLRPEHTCRRLGRLVMPALAWTMRSVPLGAGAAALAVSRV